jgi:chaperonin cofactor prefoldin
MVPHIIHAELEGLRKSLDALADTVFTAQADERTMQQMWGWNFPAVNRHDLSRVPRELSGAIRERGPEELDEAAAKLVKDLRAHIDQLTPTTTQYLWNGHGHQAVPAYLATLDCVRASLEPLIGWQAIRDVNLYPAKMARRLRTFQAQLDEIAPDKEALKEQITLIKEATGAAESLPTDLEALTVARKKVGTLQEESLLAHGKITEKLADADAATTRIGTLQEQASKLVAQCEEAYRITTTKGLAAAFERQAQLLNRSMWVWVIGFVLALAIGSWAGTHRLDLVVQALNTIDAKAGAVWVNGVLALLSFGAPFWVAWLAVKQIRQRFRLGQDYGFKASVAKAYEGYRKEAARIDSQFEARLFASALTRLEEHPLRLVEEAVPSSPWHEFVQSETFASALNSIPGFREEYNKARIQLDGAGSRAVGLEKPSRAQKETVAE